MAKAYLDNIRNIPGALFVDTTCIDCGTCFHIAPQIFEEFDGLSIVQKQPSEIEDWRQVKEAMVSCPTNSIGVRDVTVEFKKAQVQLPREITNGIYYCGFASKDSYGASSYFIHHPDCNILVDSPRFNNQLAKKLEVMGGVDLMFLTHRDDVADHQKFVQYFNCKRIIHRGEVSEATKDCEIILEGDQEIKIFPFLKAIPTPGHTLGHMVLLYQNHYLFSGDHLFFDQKRNKIYASRSLNWYSWPAQIESIQKLGTYYFDWIFPGHGGWGHKSVQEMRSDIEAIFMENKQGEQDEQSW